MQIKNLAGLSIQTLADCLNLSFADYVIPLYVSSDNLARKMIRENIDPEWSVGVFDGQKMVGLILHGVGLHEGQKVLYNGGTGILPAYRGQSYTQLMYQFLLPKIIREGIHAILLEVIDINERALKVYQKLGFAPMRVVDCFRGEVPAQTFLPQSPQIQLEKIAEPIWEELSNYFDYPPTWQNDLPALQHDVSRSITITARHRQQYLGYLIYSDYNLRLSALAIHPLFRRQGIGKALLHQLPAGMWSALNIDRRNESTVAFLKNMGWEKTIGQIVMKWEIPQFLNTTRSIVIS